MNVLIVDQDDVDREYIKRVLLRSCDTFVVEETSSVEHGLALFHSSRFDVILLDCPIAKCDAVELLMGFKKRPKKSATAIIVVSHAQDEVFAVQCIREGAQDFIVKSQISEESIRRSITYAQARYELEFELYIAAQKRKDLEEKDPLTGLVNRQYFTQILSLALKSPDASLVKVGLVLIDIDNFKLINDSMGYPAGDQALIYTSNKLRSLLPEGTLLARMGGNDFAYYFTFGDTSEAVLNTLDQIIKVTSMPVILDGSVKVVTNVSIGVALSVSRHPNTNTLIRDAEIAMHRAKKQGGQQYCFFQESMQLQMRRRVDLENGLIRAIDKGGFELNYQPVYGDSGTSLWGFEVLIRWENAGETVSPDEFIGIAEETKLIQPIGEWVIDSAFAELSRWNKKLGKRLKLAINLSPVQLENEALVPYIADKLAEYDLDPALIEFEMTETALLDFSESNVGTVKRLADLGCDISLDDFGTGFSSFTGLKKLPISVIKVDRSMMPKDDSDVFNKKLFGALIAMIDHLGLTAVAEGVETHYQYHYCREVGVERLQGYYLHKATSLNDQLMKKLLS